MNHQVDPIRFASGSDLHRVIQAMRTRKVRACRRCGCTENTPCWDGRLMECCCWVEQDLCSACLSRPEFERFLRGETKPSTHR